MSLQATLSEYIRACFTGLWIESHEHTDAIAEIARLCQAEQWQLATWNIATGLSVGAGASNPGQTLSAAPDPLAALRIAGSRESDTESTFVLVLQNFNRFLQSPEIVQTMVQQIIAGKQTRSIIVVLSPVVDIPRELEKLMVVIEHDMPDRDQLESIARETATGPGELPTEEHLPRVIDAAIGLTRMEAENAFSLSVVREGRISAETLWEQKSQMLKKSGLLSLYRGTEDFSSLGGLQNLKTFAKRALLQSGRNNPNRRARGVMLLSPPGCGKSAFCKALGRETGRPVLMLDVGTLLGSLVGQSEQRTREALRIIDAMAPCIAMIDEIQRAFAGVGGAQGDSGVSSRMFGTFLSWLNDHTSDVFVVCTANDVSSLPPEFSRAERFDGVFFVDLPSREEKDLIWQQYLELFELDRKQRFPDDHSWTGAEIRACCRLAALLDVPLLQAAQNIVPVATTSGESVEKLRQWASGRCLDASRSGIYQYQSPTANKRRKLQNTRPNPSNN